ncbi:unnamed protein product [Paramecium sonneborni]|uniref:Uncharacterized protein n=1 Tax=Paramecium sonneborni TaxID=65129 RepID=A0A8S1MB71_9CILI|nr:unnamed protein product [Paramecium sonneborni]
MDITLNFKDSQEELNYGLYSHKIDFNLFKRLLYSMLIGSFSGSIYFLVIGNYLYIILGSYMFVQTIIAILLSKKSIKYLNIVALVYQIEIQTLLATLITLLDNSLHRGTIMMITTSAFQMSVCLSIGTKCTLKLLVSLYSTIIQLVLSLLIETVSLVWIGFAFFSLLFAFQVTYYQELEKRQKYTLHQNAQKIKENLINQIEIPIVKCFSNEKDIKLIYSEANKCAQNTLNIIDQSSFIRFTRDVIVSEGKTTSILTKQSSILQFQGKQNLEQLIHRFFKKQVGEDSILHKTFQAYRCRVKHLTQEYLCQLILLHEDQPLCVIYLQKTYDDLIIKTNEKMILLNQLLKRCVKENFEKINTQQQCLQLLYKNLKQNNLIEMTNKLAQELLQLNIYFANCKILFNSNHFHFQTKISQNLVVLIQQIHLSNYQQLLKQNKIQWFQKMKFFLDNYFIILLKMLYNLPKIKQKLKLIHNMIKMFNIILWRLSFLILLIKIILNIIMKINNQEWDIWLQIKFQNQSAPIPHYKYNRMKVFIVQSFICFNNFDFCLIQLHIKFNIYLIQIITDSIMMKRNSTSRVPKVEIQTELLSIKLIQHNPNINFDKYEWCQKFSEIIHADKLKSHIAVSNEKVSIIKGKNIYSWGVVDKSFTFKQEKSDVLDTITIDSRCFILDKDKKVYKPNDKQILFSNIKAIRNFQNALILLTSDNQLLDERQNKLKQNIEDVQISNEFLVIQTKINITIAGKFPFQQNFDIKALKISCGLQHVMCLSQDGQLYIWGEGKSGQIGNGSLKQQQWPQLVMTNVQDIAAGTESSTLLKANKIYYCGTNELINKQHTFIPYQSDYIFIRIYSCWSQIMDVQYAHYVDFDQELYDELNKIVKQIEDDDLLLPDENLTRQTKAMSTHESQMIKKPLPPQIFGQTTKQSTNSSIIKSKSKTPQKKLKFQLD